MLIFIDVIFMFEVVVIVNVAAVVNVIPVFVMGAVEGDMVAVCCNCSCECNF